MSTNARARAVVEEMFSENTAFGRTGRKFKTSHTSMPLPACDYVVELADRLGAERTVEIGLGLGVASIFLASRRSEGAAKHVAVDPFQHSIWDAAGLVALELAGLEDDVRLVQRRSEDWLPGLAGQSVRFDLALVDGDHHFEHVLMDLHHLARCLSPGGRIVVDDIHLPSVRGAVGFFVHNLGWRTTARPGLRDDLGRERLLVLEPRDDVDRSWDHFVPFL
ncbi:class I SAM-dependent methyltransferase [Saccharopolyspora taberi]|uniref:Class I SAM-dependent methyltransferase n=1 Tax=Saccharopolyspora taberi TaxID=60895 RepID=A0ABN3VHY3_9PSEU